MWARRTWGLKGRRRSRTRFLAQSHYQLSALPEMVLDLSAPKVHLVWRQWGPCSAPSAVAHNFARWTFRTTVSAASTGKSSCKHSSTLNTYRCLTYPRIGLAWRDHAHWRRTCPNSVRWSVSSFVKPSWMRVSRCLLPTALWPPAH